MANTLLRDVPPDDVFDRTQTIAGSEVRIYSRDTGGTGRIHGAYWARGDWHMASWYPNGYFHPVNPNDARQHTCALDLLEAP